MKGLTYKQINKYNPSTQDKALALLGLVIFIVAHYV